MTMNSEIKFDLEPTFQDIENAGDKGRSFLKSHGFSDNSIQAPIMILREFIKNSIKHGRFTPRSNKITVCIHIGKNTFTIEVKNPVDETCYESLRELDQIIQFIKGYQDPFEPYAIKLGEVSNYPHYSDSTGLNLVRLAYSGQAHLDFFVGDDNILNMTAVGNLDSKS